MKYDAKQASEILGVSRTNVCMMCARYNVPKFGKQYVIDDDTLEMLKSRRGKTGRPKGSPNKPKDMNPP